jgi:hypothetical protein
VLPDDLTYYLTAEEKVLLETLLISRYFDLAGAIAVVILASGEGVVLTQ